jgi:hypothetical protein
VAGYRKPGYFFKRRRKLNMGKYFIQHGKSWFQFDNGEKVQIFPVARAIILEIDKANPEPQPPMLTSEVGDGTTITEPNEADPDWMDAHKKWSEQREIDYEDVMLRLGCKAEVDKDLLAQTRAYMKARFKVDLDPDDNFTYIKYCLLNAREQGELYDAVVGRSKPAEGAIARAIEDFSNNLPE